MEGADDDHTEDEELDVAPGSRPIPEWGMKVSEAKGLHRIFARARNKEIGKVHRFLENRKRVVVSAALDLDEYFGNDAEPVVVPLGLLSPGEKRILTDLTKEQAEMLPRWRGTDATSPD